MKYIRLWQASNVKKTYFCMAISLNRRTWRNGGGGLLGIYTGGGVPWIIKKGGLGCGHSPRGGGAQRGWVLGAGITRKNEGLRCGYNLKRGLFGTGFVKREGLRNWSFFYLFIIFTFTCQNDQSVGCVLPDWNKGGGGVLGAGTTQKRGVFRCRPNSKKGVSGAGQVKRGLYRGTYIYWTYMRVQPPGINILI